jgi:hypothetical protein
MVLIRSEHISITVILFIYFLDSYYYILVLSIMFLHLQHIYNINAQKLHDLPLVQTAFRIFSIISTFIFYFVFPRIVFTASARKQR